MKRRTQLLIPLLAMPLLGLSVGQGATVFLETFTLPSGTPLVGSAANVGGTWTGSGPTITKANTYDTAGGSYQAFDTFTSALGAGKILTLNYDTLVPAAGAGTVFSGWGGVSLFSGGVNGTEQVFTGNSTLGGWGTDGQSSFWIDRYHDETDGDTQVVNHVEFTYNYDSGAITFTTDNGGYSGVEEAGVALNALRIGNGAGDQLSISNLSVDISTVPVVTFGAVSPANGSYSGSRTSVSLQAIDGNAPVNTNTIVMKVDGGTVAPAIAKSANITTINYVPGSPLSAGALHLAQVTLADSNGVLYTNSWSFTTAFQSLPSVLPGPIVASNQELGIVIFSTNDAWLGGNYGPASGNTIYARFSMEFDNLNGKTNTTSGGAYGGLQFLDGGITGTPYVIAGDSWLSTNWSEDPYPPFPETDLNPVTPIVFGQWHTIVERVDLSPAGTATVTTWLDPDFTQPEASQPNSPIILNPAVIFDTIALRTGNGITSATFSNIIMSATGFGVGFPPGNAPTIQNLVPASGNLSAAVNSPIGGEVVDGSYGVSTQTVVLTLDGSPVTPTFVVTANTITASYQPPTPFVAGSSHSVALSCTDSNGNGASANWNFTVDQYPSLPAVFAGPETVVGNNYEVWGPQNAWIGANYGSASTNTLYVRWSMAFPGFSRTAGAGDGGWGGLEFYLGNTEQVLVGDDDVSTNWSVALQTISYEDIPPVTPIVAGEWHTLVVKSVYSNTNTEAALEVWLDPDFTKTEGNQPILPLSFTAANTFDNVELRAGGSIGEATYTNVVAAATAEGVGFAAAVPAGKLSIKNQAGSLSASWTSIGTLQVASVLTGPWTDYGSATNQTNPQVLSVTNTTQFFRLRQ